MKTVARSLLAVFLAVVVWAPAAQGRLANAGLAGLRVKSLEHVLRLNEREVDLATAVLISSEYWSQSVPGLEYLARLDEMAILIRERMQDQQLRPNHLAVPVINQYLFEELGYKSIAQPDDPNDLFLHSVMDRRRGYCLSLSVLYLALGERLGLPLYGVVVPGHFFVRYDDGRIRFNIETTHGGSSPGDQHYMVKFNVPDGPRDSIYMRNLNKIQTLGCFFNNLGNVYTDIGDPNSARVALERAVRINPALSESRANLGNLYLMAGEVDEAVAQYRAALQLNPNDPKTHNNIGNAYLEKGLFLRARASYRQSLELDPNFLDAHRNLALAYSRQQQYLQSLMQLRRAMRIKPNDAKLHHQAGDVYFQMGRHADALAQFEEAVQFDRNMAEAHYGKALCYQKLGRVGEETQSYKDALELQPTLIGALVGLGKVHFDKKDFDTAIEYYMQAASIRPNDGLIFFNVGSAYLNKEDFEHAQAAYLKAVQAEPGLGEAHHGLAYASYMLKDYALALKHANQAKKLGVDLPRDFLRAVQERAR